ncbi:strucutural protein [Synechococcus phage S-RSM4]|uniref:Strucutural protein n=1 Tax=Synechococcus phage S-RSM4 TaxID=555387 RepID=C7BVB5_9CAUD|nr:virion structural protein [Synechococcus phage S-RSM4]CAR63344.1 strucutural protein [Synechococcus phage S-RSM4]
MAQQLEKFDSAGGFSIEKTTVIDEGRNAKDLNSLEIKNSFYSDSSTTNYILRGLNTAVLQLDDVGTQISINSSTLNFITGNIMAVNPAGLVYSAKIESAVAADGSGNVSVLSSMTTVIKDQIPSGQTWSISPLGALNRFSYSTTRAGTTNVIRWIVSTQVVSIAWA